MRILFHLNIIRGKFISYNFDFLFIKMVYLYDFIVENEIHYAIKIILN